MQAKGPTLDITVLRDRKGPNNQLMPIDNSCFEKIIVFQYVMRVCSTLVCLPERCNCAWTSQCDSGRTLRI